MNYKLLHKFKLLPVLLVMALAGLSQGVQAQCQFTYSPSFGCVGTQVTFVAPPGATNISWDFGNSKTALGSPASVQYSAPGTFTVQMIATVGGNPCTTSVNYVVKPKPQLKIKLNSPLTQCYKSNSFCFTDSSDGGAGSSIISAEYLFTDGTIFTVANPSKPYQFCYSYKGGTVTTTNIGMIVKLTDANGCVSIDSNIYTLQVYGDLGLDFTSNKPIGCGTTVATFTNNSKADSTDLAFWEWDFGDGSKLTNIGWKPAGGLKHTYTTNGTFNGKLTVISKDGCSDSYTFAAAATNVVLTPKIVPDIDSTCFAAPTVKFTVIGIPSMTFTPDSIVWNFGDPPTGQKNFAFQKVSTEHDFSGLGPFFVSVRVKKFPCDITVKDTIWILGPQSKIEDPPNGILIAGFERYQCVTRDSVHFTNVSKFYRNDYFFQNEDSAFNFPPNTPKTNSRDNVYRLWDLGDQYTDRCTTDTRAGLNINASCRFSLDSLPVHYYRPWDSIYHYQFGRRPMQTTVFDNVTETCKNMNVYPSDSAVVVIDSVVLIPFNPTLYNTIKSTAKSTYRLLMRNENYEAGYQKKIMQYPAKFRICNGDSLFNVSKNLKYGAPVSGCITIKIPKDDYIVVKAGDTAFYEVDTMQRRDTVSRKSVNILIKSGEGYRLDSVQVSPGVKKLNTILIASPSDPTVIIDSALHRKLFFRNTAQCITVTLYHKDTSRLAPYDCEHSDRVQLALNPPSAIGLSEEGIKCFAPPSPPYGVIFKLANTKPGCTQEFIAFNFDSLSNPGVFIPQSGLNPPPLPGVNPWPPTPPYPNQFVKPYTPAQVADKKKGWVTVGLVIKQGLAQNQRYGTAICEDTLWYHRFLRFLYMNAAFNITKPAKADKTICKYETIIAKTVDPIQDSSISVTWNWGDGKYNAEYHRRFQKHPTDPTKLINYLDRYYIDGNSGDTISKDTIWTAVIHKYSTRVDYSLAEAILGKAFEALGLDINQIPKDQIPKYFKSGPSDPTGCIDTTGFGNLLRYGYYPDSITIVHKRDSSITDTIVHQYTTVGRFNVVLTTTNSQGCITFSGKEVDVGFYSHLQTTDTITCRNTSISFRDSILYWAYQDPLQLTDPYMYWRDPNRIINGRETIKWDMDTADHSQNFNINGPLYTYNSGYPNAGSYIMAMAMKDSMGCRDTIYQRIYVSGAKAGFYTVLPTPACNAIITFVDTSKALDPCSPVNGVPCDSIVWREWDFGDGKAKSPGEANLTTVGHFYTSNDTFHVKLKVRTFLGCEDSTVFTLIIPGPKPSFVPFTDTVICKGESVTFLNTTRDEGPTPPAQWTWSFGDNSSNNSLTTYEDTAVTHRYDSAGTYYVYLSIYDEIPGTGIFCYRTYPDTAGKLIDMRISIRVLEVEEASFVASDTVVCPKEAVQFDATNSSPQYTSFFFIFGDGDTVTSANPVVSHSYDTAGYYRVIMIPNYIPQGNDKKCPDQDTLYIRVVNVVAEFSTDSSNVPEFKFTNQSTGANSYEWFFTSKDNPPSTWTTQSTQKDPTYNYSTNLGLFWACLIATSSEGCKDTVCHLVNNNLLTEIKVYNVFSPNNDGSNDVFDIDIKGEIKYDLLVYNRWGERVFESTDSKTDWNGKAFNKGQDCPDGTYFYVLKYQLKAQEEKEVRGTITLIRDKQ